MHRDSGAVYKTPADCSCYAKRRLGNQQPLPRASLTAPHHLVLPEYIWNQAKRQAVLSDYMPVHISVGKGKWKPHILGFHLEKPL